MLEYFTLLTTSKREISTSQAFITYILALQI
jgi:hypothetical protein